MCYLKFKDEYAKAPQPIIKASPPSGVIAPNILISVKLRAYKLPEKTTIPIIKAHPAITKLGCENSV